MDEIKVLKEEYNQKSIDSQNYDFIDQLQSENEKLREIIRKMREDMENVIPETIKDDIGDFLCMQQKNYNINQIINSQAKEITQLNKDKCILIDMSNCLRADAKMESGKENTDTSIQSNS